MTTPYKTKKFKVSYEGYSYEILSILGDHIGSFHEHGRFYEADEGQTLDVLYKKYADHLEGGTFLDIGAHIGNHSVFFRDILGMEGKSVEVNLDLIPILEANVHRRNIIPNPCHSVSGLSYKFSPPPKGNSGLGKLNTDTEEGHAVPQTTTVDKICGLKGFIPDLIKIDVEGTELDVLAGAENVILYFRPFLVIETSNPDIFPYEALRYNASRLKNNTETWIYVPRG